MKELNLSVTTMDVHLLRPPRSSIRNGIQMITLMNAKYVTKASNIDQVLKRHRDRDHKDHKSS